MTHAEELKRMEEHLKSLGVPRSACYPSFYPCLWRIGIKIPPPLFTPFLTLAFVLGAFYTLVWGLLMWIFIRVAGLPIPTLYLCVVAPVTGTLFAASSWQD